MSSVLERIAVQLSRKNRQTAAVAAVLLGATVSGVLWWLAGARQATGEPKGDWVNVLYGQIGVPYPRASLAVAIVLGGVVGFVLLWLITTESEAANPPTPTVGSNPLAEVTAPIVQPDAQSGMVEVHERRDERLTVRYPRPFVRTPNLRLKVRGGWGSYEILDEEPDKFVFRVSEVTGLTVILWTATGKVADE